MKKYLILTLTLGTLFYAHAQNKKLSIYANIGTNTSNFIFFASGGDKHQRSWKTAARYGVGAKYFFKENRSISFECNKEEKGWLKKENVLVITSNPPYELIVGSKNLIYSFITLPMIMTFYKNNLKNHFFYEIGFSPNILLRNRSTITSTPQGTNGNIAELVYPQDGYLIDLSIINGIGYTHKINEKINVFFTLRYSLTVTPIGDFGLAQCCFRHQAFSPLLGLSYQL